MKPLWFFCVALGTLSSACASWEWAPFQNTSIYDPPAQKPPSTNIPVARVGVLLGSGALITHSKDHSRQNHLLGLNDEIFPDDLIETGGNAQVELLMYPSVPTPSFLRMSEGSKGYFSFAPHPDSDKQEPAFFLQQGKVLAHARRPMTVQTSKMNAVFSSNTALVTHDEKEGSWVGTLVGNTQVLLRDEPASRWNALLAPGEQIFPNQLGDSMLHLSPELIHQILTTSVRAQKTLPYLLNNPDPSSRSILKLSPLLKTEPLLVQFHALPSDTLNMLGRWIDLQEKRWDQYVYERNQQRRDRLSQNRRYQ